MYKFVELRNLEHFECLLIGLILGCDHVNGAVGDESNQDVQILVATLVRVNLQRVFANNEEGIVEKVRMGLTKNVCAAEAPDEPVKQLSHFVVVPAVHSYYRHNSQKSATYQS